MPNKFKEKVFTVVILIGILAAMAFMVYNTIKPHAFVNEEIMKE